MTSTDIKLYDIFRKDLHLPEQKAQELVATLDEAAKIGHDTFMQTLATKEFVKDESHLTKEFVKDEIHRTKELVKDEIHRTKELVIAEAHRLDIKLEQTKSEMTKAIFWAGLIQFLAVVGSVIAIISFMMRK